MYFIFSGEGNTDMGNGLHEGYCTGDSYRHGPLSIIADQIHEDGLGYSFIACELAVFVHPAELERIKAKLRNPRRTLERRGRKTPPEMKMHRRDARALAHASRQYVEGKDDKDFVAVLFRDCDSPKEKDWNDKRNSILTGFQAENIETQGVAAVAQPISEAWWLNALDRKANPNRTGKKYEGMRRGGNEGDHRLKKELGESGQRDALVEMVKNKDIDYNLIDSASFLQFRTDFEKAVGLGHLHRERNDS